MIDKYYSNIILFIQSATADVILHNISSSSEIAVAGWNDFVRDKHMLARNAFIEWCAANKPKSEHVFSEIQHTRAAFKYAFCC